MSEVISKEAREQCLWVLENTIKNINEGKQGMIILASCDPNTEGGVYHNQTVANITTAGTALDLANSLSFVLDCFENPEKVNLFLNLCYLVPICLERRKNNKSFAKFTVEEFLKMQEKMLSAEKDNVGMEFK